MMNSTVQRRALAAAAVAAAGAPPPDVDGDYDTASLPRTRNPLLQDPDLEVEVDSVDGDGPFAAAQRGAGADASLKLSTVWPPRRRPQKPPMQGAVVLRRSGGAFANFLATRYADVKPAGLVALARRATSFTLDVPPASMHATLRARLPSRAIRARLRRHPSGRWLHVARVELEYDAEGHCMLPDVAAAEAVRLKRRTYRGHGSPSDSGFSTDASAISVWTAASSVRSPGGGGSGGGHSVLRLHLSPSAVSEIVTTAQRLLLEAAVR